MTIKRGPSEDRIVLTGEVEAVISDNLVAPQLPVGAQLTIGWLAPDGTMVKKGERVVEFDASTFLSAIEDKRTNVINAENELESEAATASLDLSAKVLEVEKARGELKKTVIMATLPSELLSPRDYQQNVLNSEVARDKVAAAEEALSSRKRQATLDRTVKEVKKSRAERELADLLKRLEDLVLLAPRDGMVQLANNWLEKRKFLVGDATWPGWTVATLPDLSAMQVRALLSDVDDGAVAAGMAAECTLDAYPQKRFSGTVQKVSPAARGDGKDSLRRFFEVEVALDSQAKELMRPGMSARVEVIRRRVKDGLLVPRAAILQVAGKSQVRLENGDTEKVEVDFCTELECVVRGGLREGARLLPQIAVGKGAG